jgi:hypothetical protein
MGTITAEELIAFEHEAAEHFAAAKIHSPVHFSGGNEEQAIWIFDKIKPGDWVFSTWRSHYHALLCGVPRAVVMKAILDGKSMNLNFPEYQFFSSAIVGGTLPMRAAWPLALSGVVVKNGCGALLVICARRSGRSVTPNDMPTGMRCRSRSSSKTTAWRRTRPHNGRGEKVRQYVQ